MADKTLTVTTKVKDKASPALKKMGKEGKKAGQSIALGFIKAKIAIGGFHLAVRAVKSAIKSMTTELANQGDMFAKMSKRLGVSIESLSAMSHAAELSGASFQSVANGLKFLAKNSYDASKGMGEALDAFKDLNIEVADANGNLRDLDDLFAETAGKLGEMGNAGERAAIAQRIFGRSALDLIPLMKEGEAGIAAMIEEAKELGIVWSDSEGRMAEAFVDAQTRLTRAVDGIKKSIGVELFPVLTRFAEKAAKWLAEHRGLIRDGAKDVVRAIADALFDAVRWIVGVIADIKTMVDDIRKALGLSVTEGRQVSLEEAQRQASITGPAGNHPGGSLRERWQGRIDNARDSLYSMFGGGELGPSSSLPETEVVGSEPTMFKRFTDGMKDTLENMNQLDHVIRRLGQTFVTATSEGITNFFDAITFGSMNAGEAFKQMARDIIRSLQQIATQELARQFFSTAISVGSSAFGGGTAGGTSSAGPEIIKAIDTNPGLRDTIAGQTRL